MTQPKNRLVADIWDAILNDKWMWVPVWGEQRTGKTTIQMQCSYAVYNDWDKVLQSFVFNLSGATGSPPLIASLPISSHLQRCHHA